MAFKRFLKRTIPDFEESLAVFNWQIHLGILNTSAYLVRYKFYLATLVIHLSTYVVISQSRHSD